jgi:hypothetical protein
MFSLLNRNLTVTLSLNDAILQALAAFNISGFSSLFFTLEEATWMDCLAAYHKIIYGFSRTFLKRQIFPLAISRNRFYVCIH